MRPKFAEVMQQPSREFSVRRATVVGISLVIIVLGAAVLWVWPPAVAVQFGTGGFILLLASVMSIGFGLILLGFVRCEIGNCRKAYEKFELYFGFDVPLTPEGREGMEAEIRKVLSQMVKTLRRQFARQEELVADLKAGNFRKYFHLEPKLEDGTTFHLSGAEILTLMEAELLELTVAIKSAKKKFHRAVDTATSGWLLYPYPWQRFGHRYEDYAPVEREEVR